MRLSGAPESKLHSRCASVPPWATPIRGVRATARFGCAAGLRDDVHAVVHPVDEIDVRVAARPAKGFDFDDVSGGEAGGRFVHQHLPE